jgi:outer membrane protein TolC
LTGTIQRPPTVLDCDTVTPRYLTLSQAIALALENGTVGSQSILNPGFGNDTLQAPTGQGAISIASDSIRVLSLDPAIIGANIESSLSKFDAQWNTSVNWNTTDKPSNGLAFLQNGTGATFSTGIIKPLPTGGVAGITFDTVYQDLSNPQARTFTTLNPNYQPQLQFAFEQPLLQGYGVEINQLRTTLVNATNANLQFLQTGQTEGILITRIRFDQARAEFERVVQFMLLNVETAYWNLYGAYWTLYSRESALRQAFEAWRINKARFEAGRVAIQEFAQARQQYELFRGQRLTALGQVLEDERQLRTLIGLPRSDGTRLIPIDAPTLTPYNPDWETAAQETLTLKPELIAARQDLKFRQLEVILQKNSLLPDLRLTSQYNLYGIGTRLDGPSDVNAFRSLATGNFSDWQIGLRMFMPIGFHDAHSQVRAARLNLARSYLAVQDLEQKSLGLLELQYRHLFEFHLQIETQRSQRLAAAQFLNARFQEFLAGRAITLDILLEAQRVWADALNQEYAAIVQYNNALAGFEWAKGTILQHDNVVISEGPLPACAQKRAVVHEEERANALVLRERANPSMTACACNPANGAILPDLPANSAVVTPDGKGHMETSLSIPQPPVNEAPRLNSVLDNRPMPLIKDPPTELKALPTKLPSLGTSTDTSGLGQPRTLPLTLPDVNSSHR